MKRFRTATAVALALGLASSARAGTFVYEVLLLGQNERPNPVFTEGFGNATVTFDDVSGQMTVDGTFTALSANAIFAHVHCCAPQGSPGQSGTTAPPVIDLSITSAQFGTFGGTGVIPQDKIDDVLAGLSYLNVHSLQNLGGEVRGQIVPEPATALLGGIGLAGLGVLGRRRRA